jgi:hypothetical protein
MSPVRRSTAALPSEKILATAGIYRALMDELHVPEVGVPGEVIAALIDASVFIAMGTDTTDMGILIEPVKDDAQH